MTGAGHQLTNVVGVTVPRVTSVTARSGAQQRQWLVSGGCGGSGALPVVALAGAGHLLEQLVLRDVLHKVLLLLLLGLHLVEHEPRAILTELSELILDDVILVNLLDCLRLFTLGIVSSKSVRNASFPEEVFVNLGEL